MKNCYIILILFFLTAFILNADNLSTISTYVSSHPLGEDFKVSTATEGPVGSIVVPSPGTGKEGSQSLGTGFSYVKLETAKLTQIPISYSYTLMDGLDLAVAVPYISLNPDGASSESEIGDLYAGLKYGLLDDEFKAAVSIGAVFATGDKKIMGQNNDIDLLIDLPVEREFDEFVLNLDFGIAFMDMGSSIDDETFKIAGAVSRSFSKIAAGSLELVYQDNDSSSSLLAALGLKYLMDAKNSFTFTIGKDLHKDGLDLLLSLGYSRSL